MIGVSSREAAPGRAGTRVIEQADFQATGLADEDRQRARLDKAVECPGTRTRIQTQGGGQLGQRDGRRDSRQRGVVALAAEICEEALRRAARYAITHVGASDVLACSLSDAPEAEKLTEVDGRQGG